MMLLLHGLPNTTKYHDIKILVKRETSLNNFILDNLLTDNDGSKKVTIGVSDEQEGAHLMKCLNGYRVPPGNILRIIPMGKSGSQSQPMNAPQQTGYDHRGGFPRNSYQGNPEPVYNRSVPNDPVRTEARVDPWGQSSGQRSQWTPNQSAPSQSAQGYNNYQGSGNMMSSGQQAHNTPQHQRPDMRPNAEVRPYQHQQTQEQRYGYQPKNNIPDPALAQKHQRSHFLRSVEIIDEPIPRTVGHPSDGYPDRHPQQKPITIMKDNFQGPQYGLDRATQPSTQFQGHNQSPWTQAMQTQKLNPAPYDRKYPEPEKRPLISKEPDTYKGLSGPRFSPRREMLNEPRFSPRKDVPKDMGPRYSPRREIKPGPRFSPRRDSKNVPGPGSGPRFSPRRDIKDVSGPRFSPRRDIKESMPPGPRFSPRRDIKPVTGPRFSPRRDVPRFSPRRDKEGPRFSPRRDVVKEPGGPGARYSPSREIHVPHGRRPSPGPVRRMSPARRISPGPMDRRRRESPPGHRRISPGRERYSPSRHLDKGDKYPDRGGFKDVRPAYEPSQASNQAMYSGGYRPSVHDNVQYPVPGARPDQRPPTWQENKPGFAPAMTKDDGRMPKFEPRIERDIIDKRVPKFEPRDVIDKRSPIRKSRSPLRRDRSPIRDRFKKHSPSPRSPRRSWALEKRRSPEPREPPPPPMWPGQNHGRPDEYRGRNFEEEKPRMPVWERPSFDDKMDRPRRPDERAFEDARRPDLAARRPVPETRPHFSARDPNDFRRMEDDRKPFGRREESPRREERKIIVQDQLQKEIDDVYKRAVEFHKRVEERKSSERRRTEFDDRGREMERHDAKEMDYRERRDDRHDLRRYDEPRRDELRSIREEPRSVREEPRSVRDEPRGVRDEPRSIRDEPRMREPATNRPPEWRTEKDHQATLSAEVKAKREKAVEQISERIIEKHGPNFNIDLKRRVQDELKLTLSKLIREMFGEKDVSFIEIVIKFNAKYDVDDEKRIFDDVMSGFPSQYRSMKRPVDETAHHVEVPPKTAKIATDAHLNRDVSASVTADPVNQWTIQPASMLPMMPPTPYDLMPHMTNMPMPQLIIPPPLMVPAPTYALRDEPKFQEKSSPISAPSFTNFSDQQDLQKEGYNIYLCKDDSEPFSECQAEYLKKFLVSQLINVSSSGQGWTPDFTIKGLQTKHRYEVFTNDETTKNWIDNLDFSEFSLFNVLVYTKEELWYERAAVWLPGHSRCRNIEPLTKLKLQNKWLEGVNIGKWKFVKKVVNAKGTRLYVDMPPSSARALEKHKMMLSYELQKVNVILKAAAVDKDSFDIGLKDCTVISQAEIVTATQNSAMPTLGQDPNVVKISLKGNKTVSLVQARKIKEMIIYHIYKYQQDNGNTRTDFLKYGLCNPGYFGVLPENSESRRWLMNLQIGKLNKHAIVVIGSDSDTKYIKVEVIFRDETANNAALLTERLKQSNKGVKGLNFNKWKPVGVKEARHHVTLEIEMDLDSLETLSKMDFKLDYVNERNRQWTVDVRYDNSRSRLEEKIKRYKTEQNDSYDVDDMEIGSDFEMDDDDDIIFVGKDTVKRPSRPPSRKYDQHKKMAPPTYKPKPYPMSRTRDTSVVRKRPYPLERPTTAPMQRKMSAPLRRVPEQNAKASTPKSGAPTSKSAASTSKSAPSTSKSEASTPKSAPPASKSAPTSKSEASTSKSALSTSKSEASTSKSALSTSKSEASTPKSAEKTADKAKRKTDVAGNLMDFDDDLDIKGLREEPPSEGHYELNPLMSRVLEKELQTIMIKVWQDLPDKPANAAEKAVVDKLRTEAGDDLKNVLGLNVSKRLLNIHNPLYVKVVLSRKPDRVSLKEFVKTYNCIGLKYVPCQAHQYTFVAQFKHFSDFDKICTTKIVRCGNERVSIIPCYKFTTCPPHLKSIYSVNSQKDDANNAEDKETKVTPESKTTEPKVEETKTETSANQTTNDNVDNKEENPGVSKVEENKVESQAAKKEDNQTVKTETNATKVNEKPSVKVSPTNAATKAQTQNTKQPENASQSKAATNTVAKTQPQKTTTPATSTVAKTQPQKTTTPTKTPNKAQTANANATKVAANAVTKTQPQKPAPNSQQQNSTATAPQNTTQKPTPTNVAQKTTPQKSTNNTKPVPNKKPVAKTPQKATATKKTKEDEDLTAKISEMIAIDEVYDDDVKPEADEEVLDDEDILALMSGAIVLDECRGSDEE